MIDTIELVIFDCDGTLVDSEPLANGVFIETVNKLGADLTEAEVWENFVGTSLDFCMHYTAEKYQITYPDDFVEKYRVHLSEVFEAYLQPIPGAIELVSSIEKPMCIASNGPLQKMVENLASTSLLPYFTDRIFSAYEIDSWKPQPDLFLHAAETCGVLPQNCLVVEDSAAGIQAAVAADMRVLAFVPDSIPHVPKVGDAIVIRELKEVLDYI